VNFNSTDVDVYIGLKIAVVDLLSGKFDQAIKFILSILKMTYSQVLLIYFLFTVLYSLLFVTRNECDRQ
jgi:hypothetical protein